MATDALSIAISGLKSASRRAAIAATNTANIHSEGYTREVPVQVDLPTGGSSVSAVKDTSQRPSVVNGTPPPQGQESNVEIETEIVELIKSKQALSAAVKTIRTHYENVGAILDIKG
ncbi:MAG: hypothetical protein ACE5FU_13110 [Nitrospinota bacterium]